MIDKKYKVRRYITLFSKKTEEFIGEYELSSFDLKNFQNEFGETVLDNPMYDCYPINENNINFLKNYMTKEPTWDFINNLYYLEAEGRTSNSRHP